MSAAIIAGARRLTGSEVDERVRRGAAGLADLGVREGDVVAVMLRNDPAFLEAMLIARQAGCYGCPINWHYKADEVGFILRDSAAAALVVHADLLAQIKDGLPSDLPLLVVAPSAELQSAFKLDPAQCRVPADALEWESWLAASPPYTGPERAPRLALYYSSGTTGRPKGIRREALDAVLAAGVAATLRAAYGVAPGMRTAMVAPLYHSAPASYGVQSMLAGELLVIHPRLDPEALLADIERHRLTHLYLVPTHYVRLLRLPEAVKRRYDLSSLQFIASTGSPCPADVKRAMIDWWGPILNEGYACSELGFLTACSSEDALAKPGTAGKPLPHVDIRILDDDGRALPPGVPGLIYARNQAYPDFTYLNRGDARREMERDGLMTVGDVGYFDADGYLFVCDRKADMVISGGVNIYPAEIEAVLITMPGVADCAVFGIPDAEFGESLAAHIQPATHAAIESDDVHAFLRARIADYKVPRVIAFADDLPREESGKIFKRKLREPYWRDVGRRI
jgi:long-chain acyl-CoA synthetase